MFYCTHAELVVHSAEEILIRMKGEQVTARFLERHGFNYPIAVTEMEGLGLKLPPSTFSVRDVEQYVGKFVVSRLHFSFFGSM